MTTLTAVAAGGNWGSASTWSPAQVPTASDDCKITSTMTGTVTINGTSGSPNLCRSLDCTGLTHTLNVNGYLNVGTSTSGNFKFVSGMTLSLSSGQITFVSTTSGNTITTAGKTMPPVEFNGAAGNWTLGDNWTSLSGYGIVLTKGTLNAGTKTVNTYSFSSSNTNTRALTMSGTWTLVGTSWDISTSTGLTLTATGSTININSDTATFAGGGLTYGTLTITGTGGAPPTIQGANTFANITYNGSGTPQDAILFGASQTITGTLTLHGASATGRLLITSDTYGTARTLTSAANSMAYVDIQDITGAGASGWNLSSITGGSGDCGGNSGITFSSPINCYMKTGSSVGWYGSNWYTTSGGSTAARIPLPQDTAIFDANSITASSVVIYIDYPRISAMNWTGALNTPELEWQTSPAFFGSLTFISGMVFDSGGWTTTFANRNSINIDMGGATWTSTNGSIIQNGPGGTINQQSDVQVIVCPITLTSGTWNNNSYALSVSGNAGSLINGGTLNVGSGLVTIGNNLTMSSGTIEMNGHNMAVSGPTGTVLTISGGTLNLSGQIDAGLSDISISGGTVNDTGSAGELKCDNITFSGGTAVVRKITAVGNVTIQSSGSLILTGSATWGGSSDWKITGSSALFKTAGAPTWSSSSVTLVNGGSWTFC